MRVKTFFRFLRIISAVVLVFFLWTFGPIWQAVAFAAAPKGQETPQAHNMERADRVDQVDHVDVIDGNMVPSVQNNGNTVALVHGPENRFEKALEDIREKVGRASEKHAKGEDDSAEIGAIKAKKIEIESLDVEIRKEFDATEKRLKDAKLPQEILSRHEKFVQHYSDNYSQLKTEIDDIDKAKTKADRKAKIEKARLHLEKVKPVKKHIALDPSRLPHQNRVLKTKWREPRLKPEDFQKEFGPVSSGKGRAAWDSPQITPRTAELQKFYNSALRMEPALESLYRGNSALSRKPVLLAFNETVSDIPLSFGTELKTQNSELKTLLTDIAFSDLTQNSELNTQNLLLAQSSLDLPNADDLAEAPPAIQFTPAIRAKAQDELGCNPTKIYNWVRNNILYEVYYGSFKSAEQTLLEGAGNDFDQSSLLISLMRVCNIASKFAYGTVEIPAEKAANMVGVSDPTSAAIILATQGIPVKLVISGGTVKAIRLERAWVESWIDYFPSWGARHKPGGEDTWIPTDPAFKLYTLKQGMDMYAQMGFNAEQFLQSYITDTRDITAYQDYSMRMLSFLDTNYPDASVEDILGASEVKLTKTIMKQEFPYLLGTLPYKVIVKAAQFTEVPSTQDYAITIQIEGNSLDGTPGLNYSGYLSHLADNRVTVSYEPATSADESLVTRYGGNMLSVPPYLLYVKPVLKVDGTTVATGAPIGLGQDQNIIISFAGPDGDTDRIQNVITAGAYSAIILQSQNTPVATPSKNMAALIENSKRVESPEITLDDLLGQLLYSIGISYFETLSYENEVFAKTLQLVSMRQPSEAMVTQGVKVNYFFGLPRTVAAGGVNVDVDRNINVVYSPIQNKEREKAFMILSGLASSVSENRILEAFFNVPSVSSVRLLKRASEQGIPIYTITSTNLNEILPLLQVDADVKTDIVNAVNTGKNVIVSKTKIAYGQWSGVGYIISDPVTGAGSYMISGGFAGAGTDQTPIADPNFKVTWLDSLIFKIVRNNIFMIAYGLFGTLYGFGCKDPFAPGNCKGKIDCSGLTTYCYKKAGITLLDDKNAADQYDYSVQTDDPQLSDLVFYKGTYDTNCDGSKDANDGVTHVALYISYGNMIGAEGKGVSIYQVQGGEWAARYPKVCNDYYCDQYGRGVCNTSWQSDTSQQKFNPFVGYGKILP